MPPIKNYKIEEAAYLFRDITSKYQARRKRAPEEDVRQWAIFELLSTYGYSIQNIKVEEEVSDHGGKYRADIVIYKDKRHFAVIECKRSRGNNPEKVMQQAKNYAVDLKTEFAVYTDGIDWVVERRSGEDKWIPALDLPKVTNISYSGELGDAIDFLDDLRPLLFWLYQPIPERHAINYFSKLQLFFVSAWDWANIPEELILGTDALLKFFIAIANNADVDKKEKEFRYAFTNFLSYLIKKKKNLQPVLDIEFLNLQELRNKLEIDFSAFLKNNREARNDDINLIRLLFQLIKYCQNLIEESRFRKIPVLLTKEFENFITPILSSKLNFGLPDSIDNENLNHLRRLCSQEWLNKNENFEEFFEQE